MAVLIQYAWTSYGRPKSMDEVRVVTAILPSGEVLTRDDDEQPRGIPRNDLERTINVRRKYLEETEGSFTEDEMFFSINAEYSSMFNDFGLIKDPKEAREVIKEAKLTATVTPLERSEYSSTDLRLAGVRNGVGDGN